MENTFGERVKLLRTKANVTQKELAESLGISAASVIAYEKGQKTPSVDVAMGIAQYFSVSLDSLCKGQDPETELKTYGDVARALCVLLNADCFSVMVKPVIVDSYNNDTNEWERTTIGTRASLVLPHVHADNSTFRSSPENDFIVNYHKMHTLLKDNTLTQDIFDTWLESQISKLDAMPIASTYYPTQEELAQISEEFKQMNWSEDDFPF